MAETVPASREALVEYLEQLSGRSIRSRADLEAYLNELKSRTAAARAGRPARAWSAAKHAALAAGLLIAVLQYYLMDIYVQIESMQRVQFLNPDSPALQKSALEVLRFLC
jgi:hypothetical protein